MPDAHKAVRQYVLYKALRKIFVTQRHCFGTAPIMIIFVSEAHLLCIYGRNAVVAYGYFVGVPAQVFFRALVHQTDALNTLPMAF